MAKQFKVEDKVKIIRSIVGFKPAVRIGSIGKITQIGDGVSSDMVTVLFPDGYDDGYWPEELELL